MGRWAQASRRGKRPAHAVPCVANIDDTDVANGVCFWSGARAGTNVRIQWSYVSSVSGLHTGEAVYLGSLNQSPSMYGPDNQVEGSMRLREETASWVSEWTGWFSGGI